MSSDETTTDGKISIDEKSSGLGKLESLSQDELIKLIKNQLLLKKKFQTQINELINSNTSLSQIERELRQEIEQNQINQSKPQEELHITKESLENCRTENKILETSCQNLRDEISNLQNELSIARSSLITESQQSSSHSDLFTDSICTIIDLFQLPITLPESIDNEFLNIYKNELEQKQESYKQTFEQFDQEKLHFQQRIEDLEFFNEEIKLEIDDLRLKSKTSQQEKHLLEKEIDNYRRQVEDFEEQFLELQRESHLNHYQTFDKSQQQPSITSSSLTLHQFDDNIDETSFQCMNSILNQIDENNQHISKASLLLASDIPTLLHSVGITNCTDEEFSVPLNFESVIRLCTLLIERCRVLQYILLKKNDVSFDSLTEHHYDNDSVSFSQTNQCEQCRISIHKQDHLPLDVLFQSIYAGMNQTITSNDWQILIEKPIDQKTSSSIRLQFDSFKFVSEGDLIRLHSEYDQLLKANENQRHEIISLEQRLHSNQSYEQLKERQTYLEEQLLQQCEKTIQLENILQQANIDKSKVDQLEVSYDELQKKYHIAEQLEEQLNELNRKYNEKNLQLKEQNELFEKLKLDYEHQHFHLLERDENIRLLQFELEEHEQSEKILIEKYQIQMKKIEKDFEEQKLFVSNASYNQDQRFSSILKQQEELNTKMQLQITENEVLFEKNFHLENNFKEQKQILFEKNQHIDKLEKQLESLTIDYDELRIHFDQEKKKLISEINLLISQQSEISPNVNREENDKLQQTIQELNDKLQRHNSDSGENIPELKEKYQKMKLLLTRLKKELQDKNQQPKQSLIDLELADYEKTIQNLKDELINKDKDLQELRDELANSTDKYACLKLEIKNLEEQKIQTDERANKFKALLDLAKKELQHSKDLELQRYQNEDQVRGLIETLQDRLEANKVLINELTNEKQQLIEKLNEQNEINQKTKNLLEQNLRIAKHDFDIVKQDYDTLQDDFNSYKIRAQSVLKQQQSNQRERTPSLADKQIELEETIGKLQNTLQEAKNKIQLLISENEALQKEQDRLIEIQAKLINESRKREQDLRKQHQIEMNKIENEFLQRINDSDEMYKVVTLQNETLATAFKEQIATIESEHERAIRILKDQLQISEEEIERLKTCIEKTFEQTELDNERLTSISDDSQMGIKNHSLRDNILACSDPERQPAEELVESVKIEHLSTDVPVKTSENIPEETSSIISNITTTNDNPIPSSPSEKSRPISSETNELERQRLEEELNQMKLRLINTTELFNESELNNERLTEQVTLLKDEIRRLERNMDRAESISNLEYLKNVILKFFILKSTPERRQLIPVLVTMLKLSPDEQVQLVRVANISISNDENLRSDESPSQQITNGATSPSWSSYLNIW